MFCDASYPCGRASIRVSFSSSFNMANVQGSCKGSVSWWWMRGKPPKPEPFLTCESVSFLSGWAQLALKLEIRLIWWHAWRTEEGGCCWDWPFTTKSTERCWFSFPQVVKKKNNSSLFQNNIERYIGKLSLHTRVMKLLFALLSRDVWDSD